MSENYHTAISTGADADAATFNTPFGLLDQEIKTNKDLVTANAGGSTASDQALEAWAATEAFTSTSITRNTNGVITDATVAWPDGSAGVFTVTRGNNSAGTDIDNADESLWVAPNTITITHADSSKTVTITITRDTSHNPTVIAISA